MHMDSRFRALAIASAIAVASPLVLARQQQAVAPGLDTASLSARMPVDPQITLGTLPNGLRYYIRANREPAHRAELRLVVNAGSNLEDDNQQGLAHFVEHMAFNGTTHFPGSSIVEFMQSIGMHLGPHVNAATSYDETTYMLQVPTDRPEVLDRAFLVLEDWAHNVTFDPSGIDKERGVITEEWRLNRGAGARTSDALLPIVLQGSRYVNREPIGKMDIIAHAPASLLKQFYSDWYRPDLMGVVAVGDFDAPSVLQEIQKHFAPLQNPPNERKRPAFDVPSQPGTRYALVSDKETTSTSVQLISLLPAGDQTTIGAYREKILEHLFALLLGSRLNDISEKPDSPFLASDVTRALFFSRTTEAASVVSLPKEGQVEKSLQLMASEAQRVEEFGFTATELERQKQNLLRAYQRLLDQKDTHESSTLAEEYIRNFTTDETLPGIANEYALHQRFLPQITVKDVNALSKDWFAKNDRLVVVSTPDKAGLTLPTQASLAAALKAGETMKIDAYVDSTAGATLLEKPPTPGAIVSTSTHDIGVTEWHLANGATVVLKPTTYKEDEIVFRATAPGGTSLASDADFVAAQTAAPVVSAGGLGKYSAVDLRKLVTGKVASVQPSIGELDEGLSGGASPKDLETLFQLIYLTFTAPRADSQLFGVIQDQLRTLLANQEVSPDVAFQQARTALLTQNNPRGRGMTVADVDKMSLQKSFDFYKARFADASGFTFVFVGSFDEATIKPLVERYLASLPATHSKETWKDDGIRPPTGISEKRVTKGVEPQSRVSLVFTGPASYGDDDVIAIKAMSRVLQGRLQNMLRETIGGTYGVSVASSISRAPKSYYSVSIDFGCDPKRTEELTTAALKIVNDFRQNGPTDSDIADIETGLLRDFETASQDNNYLANQIESKYQYGDNVTTVWTLPQAYRRLDVATVERAAQRYLNTDNYVKVTLFPEK